MNIRTLTQILILFSSLSILSIGGGNTVLPEMHRKTVDSYHWLSNKQFADVFAISQAAPGPSILIVTIIGYKAAGIPGALLATLAMMIPAGILVYLVSRVWEKAKDSSLRKAIEKGLAPLTVGLILASGWVMSKAADHDWRAYALTAVCTAIFTTTKINPLFIVAAAGVVGWLGWI
ncbi:MAG: chromate transporter [Verrucomicrobiaceae bacterium]|nr:MAG: chromate transporter [Verrucomicrobiaceae bacterium]